MLVRYIDDLPNNLLASFARIGNAQRLMGVMCSFVFLITPTVPSKKLKACVNGVVVVDIAVSE